jgi:hypothetical protein
MTEELYRRCPACRESDPGAPCPSCHGTRFVSAGITLRDAAARPEKGRRRWRIRIGTLMLLVVIAALGSYILTTWWRAEREALRLAFEREKATAVAERERAMVAEAQARAIAAKANAQTPTAAPAGPTK